MTVLCLTTMDKDCSLQIRKSQAKQPTGKTLVTCRQNNLLTILIRQSFRKRSYRFLTTAWLSYPRVQNRQHKCLLVLSAAWHMSFIRLQSSGASSVLSRRVSIWKSGNADMGTRPITFERIILWTSPLVTPPAQTSSNAMSGWCTKCSLFAPPWRRHQFVWIKTSI